MDQVWLLGLVFVLTALLMSVMELFGSRKISLAPEPVSAGRLAAAFALVLVLIFVFRLIGGGDPFAPFAVVPSTAEAVDRMFFAAVAATLFGLSLWWLSSTLSANRRAVLPLVSTVGTVAVFMSFS